MKTLPRIYPSSFELRTENVNGKTFLHGRAVPYDTWTNIGPYMEMHRNGSMTKSIQEAVNGLPLLMFHDDRALPIGVSSEWNHDRGGLDGIWRLDRSDEAQEAARLADEGFLGYMSIRFQPLDRSMSKRDRDMTEALQASTGLRHVVRTESRLFEVSLVSTPAYAGAAVQMVREAGSDEYEAPALQTPKLAQWRAELAKIRG